MNNHPFGLQDDGTPDLAGLESYEKVADTLGYKSRHPKTVRQLANLAAQSQFHSFIENYCQKAGFESPEFSNPQFSVVEHPSSGVGIGYVFKLQSQSKTATKPPVSFYVVSWNLWTSVVKQAAYKKLNPNQRLWPSRDEDRFFDLHGSSLNRKLKKEVMNWGMSDAALFLLPDGYLSEYCVAKAIDRLMEDLNIGPTGNENPGQQEIDRLVIVTESLGSTIVISTINQLFENPQRLRTHQLELLSERNQQKFESLILRNYEGEANNDRVAFYMFANQFPLLLGAEEYRRAKVDSAPRGVPKFGSQRFSKIPLIAFHDPDDLLSYPLPRKPRRKDLDYWSIFHQTNVYVKNGSIGIPFVFRNPGQVHEGYRQNRKVLDFMLKGGLDRPKWTAPD